MMVGLSYLQEAGHIFWEGVVLQLRGLLSTPAPHNFALLS